MNRNTCAVILCKVAVSAQEDVPVGTGSNAEESLAASDLIFGWIVPMAFLLQPAWSWYVRRYMVERVEGKARDFVITIREITENVTGSASPEPDSPAAILVQRWQMAIVIARPGYLVMMAVMLYWGASVISAPLPPERSFTDATNALVSDLPSLSTLSRGAFVFTCGAFIFWGTMRIADRALSASSVPVHKVPTKRVAQRDVATYWPAVALLLEAARCGNLQQQCVDHGPMDLPHVQLRSTERIVRRAWRNRRAPYPPRRWRRKELRNHAASVVGALRYEEARQESHPEDALKNLTRMLATIAERYAQGRTIELLDSEDLEKGKPEYEYPLLRLLASVITLLGMLAFGVWAGVPESVVLPSLILLATVLAVLVNRAPVPGWNFLMNLFTRP
ncbi:hypothetical protein LIX60_09420 [Streptomyces sp. S07_1.15]|uniref:hypothetical protein n=1 Tax=Streptomyces sp. S07_1.15 TaxID=2873925 RepID=UPI001D154D66|nr:hypothetical protein [Streptomyces sp. S07_1.15]MCC3651681.1 hypothetical protein [Streptomyces sp. S07_1.15]